MEPENWNHRDGDRRHNGRLLPTAPAPFPVTASPALNRESHGFGKLIAEGFAGIPERHLQCMKAYDDLPAPSGDRRNSTGNPLVNLFLPARVSPLFGPHRGRRRRPPSINALHQLVPRATESFPQARSNRDSGLRTACLDPLEVGAVNLRKLAELLLRETRVCPQTGEISAEEIRRRHPSSLTILASQRRRISAAFSLRIPDRPAWLRIGASCPPKPESWVQ